MPEHTLTLKEVSEQYLAKQAAIVKERDQRMCIRCGKPADDIAHIVPRWRIGKRNYEEKHALKNLCCLCRDCHKATHTFNGRKELLNILRERHGYDYSTGGAARYLR